jgi:transposase
MGLCWSITALTNEELQLQNQELKDRVAILTQQIDWLKRQLFGRKSEQLNHPDLFSAQPPETPGTSGDEPAPEEPAQSLTGGSNTKKEKRTRKIRKDRLPEDLPVRIEEIIPAFVQANPEAWKNTGFEEKTQLEKEPAYFYIRRILRMKFVSIENPLSPPVIEPAKPTIIEGGFWGSGLLAEILSNKYLYHLPFDRQHVLNKQRYGVDLSPNTMGDAAAKVADQCGLLIGLMKQQMLASSYVRADETFIRYLDKTIPGGSSNGYFWVYRGLTGDVIFDWQTSREHRHVSEWLGPDYEGILQSDGYQAYEAYCIAQRAKDKTVLRASCLAHIRRKFENARAERPEVVDWILRIIARLYMLETPLREYAADPEVRLRVRQNRSRPLINLLEKAFKRLISTRIRPKSGLGMALQYALGQWPAMQTYLTDGRVEIDNNATENDIRPSAVGKKNWLFVGSPEAGKRSAVMYTLLISARNHGVDPQAYLKDVIERLPVTRPGELAALLPANWAAANRAAKPAIKSGRPQAA